MLHSIRHVSVRPPFVSSPRSPLGANFLTVREQLPRLLNVNAEEGLELVACCRYKQVDGQPVQAIQEQTWGVNAAPLATIYRRGCYLPKLWSIEG